MEISTITLKENYQVGGVLLWTEMIAFEVWRLITMKTSSMIEFNQNILKRLFFTSGGLCPDTIKLLCLLLMRNILGRNILFTLSLNCLIEEELNNCPIDNPPSSANIYV